MAGNYMGGGGLDVVRGNWCMYFVGTERYKV